MKFYVPNDYYIKRINFHFLVIFMIRMSCLYFFYIYRNNNIGNSKLFILSPVIIEKCRTFFPYDQLLEVLKNVENFYRFSQKVIFITYVTMLCNFR